MKDLLRSALLIILPVLLLVQCSETKEDIAPGLPDGVKELGEAPNQMEAGSAKWEGVKLPSHTNGTSCIVGSGDNENNSYWITVSSTAMYKGKPTSTRMMIILPDSGLVSGVYPAYTADKIDFNQANRVSVRFSIYPDFGYSASGDVWVKYENGDIEVRFNDLQMNDKQNGSGNTIASFSGAALCKKD